MIIERQAEEILYNRSSYNKNFAIRICRLKINSYLCINKIVKHFCLIAKL